MKINGFLKGEQLAIVHAALVAAGYDFTQPHPSCYAFFSYITFINSLDELEQTTSVEKL